MEVGGLQADFQSADNASAHHVVDFVSLANPTPASLNMGTAYLLAVR